MNESVHLIQHNGFLFQNKKPDAPGLAFESGETENSMWSRDERIEDRTGEGALQIAELEITTESMTRGSVVA